MTPPYPLLLWHGQTGVHSAAVLLVSASTLASCLVGSHPVGYMHVLFDGRFSLFVVACCSEEDGSVSLSQGYLALVHLHVPALLIAHSDSFSEAAVSEGSRMYCLKHFWNILFEDLMAVVTASSSILRICFPHPLAFFFCLFFS